MNISRNKAIEMSRDIALEQTLEVIFGKNIKRKASKMENVQFWTFGQLAFCFVLWNASIKIPEFGSNYQIFPCSLILNPNSNVILGETC